MKEQIKKLRIKTDGLAQLCKELKPVTDFKIIELGHGENIVESVRGRVSWQKQKVNSKEIEKAVDSLYLGKAWLGKLLGELGTANPYGSGYTKKEDIIPTQDVANTSASTMASVKLEDGRKIAAHFYELNHIEKVDWLRSSIEETVKEVKDIPTKDLSREFAIARTNCYTHLCEARFNLGFELERIKNKN